MSIYCKCRMQVVVIDSPAEMGAHIAALENLLKEPLEANVFYEPWMLLPAAKYLGGSNLRFAMVYADASGRQEQNVLCGFFPLEERSHYCGVPIPSFRLWKHEYCFLSTPLLRASRADDALEGFCQWLSSQETRICEFGYVSSDGPFFDCFDRCLRKRNLQKFTSGCLQRPILVRPKDANEYLRTGAFASNLKSVMRRLSRLAEKERVSFAPLESENELDSWIRDFLALEASGWKGQRGTAMACREDHRRFFESIVTEAFRRKQLYLTRFAVGDRSISSTCAFRSGRVLFSFKSAFDEAYAHYSPGVLLELSNLRCFAAQQEVDWADSCTAPDHPLLGRLWKERRSLATIAFSVESAPGRALLSLLPSVRTGYHAIRDLGRSLTR